MTHSIYTVDYFIKKFEAIPENRWAIGTQLDSYGNSCALGHCDPAHHQGQSTPEGMALIALFISSGLTVEHHTAYASRLHKGGTVHAIASINNGSIPEYQQPTPKQRILAALYDIYEKTYGRKYKAEPEPKERIVYVMVDSTVKELSGQLTNN